MLHQPPDPQVADSIGNWIGFLIVAVIGLWRRRKQNTVFARDVTENVDESLRTRVAEIGAALTTTNNLVAIHSDKLKEGNQIAGELKLAIQSLTREMATHREAIQRGDTLIKQFNEYMERAKAGTLKAEPIAGSGGLVAIKSKEDKKNG